MKIKNIIFATLLVASGCQAMGQATSQDGWHLTWHGMVNPVVFADTRQVVAGREAMMLFYPKPVDKDAQGNDRNAEPSLNMLSITARLNLTIQGPDVLGAKMKGFIEGDYTGATDGTINMFRLRHAYVDMLWNRGELLMGQYWYPMVIEEIMPGTQPLNMGAPFHPYARYTQIRGYWRTSTPLEVMAVAAFQLDNKSQGPDGATTAYLKRSMLPEFNLQLRYVGQHLFAGAAANLMWTVPHNTTVDLAGNNLVCKQRYMSYSFSLFGKYSWKHWTLKAQTMLNDNLYEGCTLGGFTERAYFDGDIQRYEYSPFRFTTVWFDFGKSDGKWRPGLFAGYAYHTDYEQSTAAVAYGRGYDLAYLWRVQPRIAFCAGNGLTFAFEVEHTLAQYTKQVVDMQGNASREADPDNKPANTRFFLSACYAF